MKAVIIISAICLFFAILLIMPLCAEIEYLLLEKGGGRLRIKVGLITPFVSVADTGKKPKEKKKKRKKSEKQKKDDGKEKKEDGKAKKKTSFEDIKDIIKAVADALAVLKKRLVIDKLKLHFHIGTGDAAKTGVATGSAWGALGGIVSLLKSRFNLKGYSVNVVPAFTKELFETDIDVKLKIKVIYILVMGIKILKGMKII